MAKKSKATKKKKSSLSPEIRLALRIVGKIFSGIIICVITIILVGILTGVIVAKNFGSYCQEYLIDTEYDITDLEFSLDRTTKIYYPVYADVERTEFLGYEELESQRLHGAENRVWAYYEDMPDNLTNAFIAIEDKRFWTNNGMDIKRTLGATLEFAKGNKSYGGSTITQQLIKNITNERDSTIQRKVTEISRAISLTEKKSKEEILEMYLNTIPLSHGNYGVATAAKYFFDKEIGELTLVECAALAAIPKSPTKYDPERNPEDNKERRQTILYEMYTQKLISKKEYEEAKDAELVLNINKEETTEVVYSYFTDELRRQVQQDLVDKYGYTYEFASTMILSGGLEIYATVDPEIQQIMEEVYADENTFEKKDEGLQPQSAMTVLDPKNGDVLGMVGGRGEKEANMILNRATSVRQIGSAIKPISVYAPAIDKRYITYGSVLDDTPAEFNKSMGRYWPRNSPAKYEGKTTISRAVETSKNTIAVKLVQMLTPQQSYNFLTKTLGAKRLVKSDIDESPMALGGLTYGMSTVEVAGAYTMLANDGIYSQPRYYTKVLDSKGNIILEKDTVQREAVDKGTAQVMTKLLTQVVGKGTATAIELDKKIEVAGKTGTTNKNYDVYFVGYTPYYVGATWFGYDQNRSLAKFGKNQALRGWDTVMTRIHERVFEEEGTLKKFDYSGLKKVQYCKDSGMLPSALCSLDYRSTMGLTTSRVETGYFVSGTEPTETCDVHTVVKWDRETKSIASDRCPAANVGEIVLIRTGDERIFDHYIKVDDASYTVMDLPVGYIYPNSQETGIFINMLALGTNYGFVPKSTGEIPVNSYCSVHGYAPVVPVVPEVPETGIPSEDDPVVGGGDNEENTEHGVEDIFDITGTPVSEGDPQSGDNGGASNEQSGNTVVENAAPSEDSQAPILPEGSGTAITENATGEA